MAIVSLPLTEPDHVDRVFAEARRVRVEAITVLPDPMTFTQRAEILDQAARHRLPAIYALREFVADGGLVSYATSLVSQYRRAAFYVDKILKGAKPDDLPVEHPIAFGLWINRRAARAIGLTMPPSLLARRIR